MQDDWWSPKVNDSKRDMPSSESCRTLSGGWCASFLTTVCVSVYTAWISTHHLSFSFKHIVGFYGTEKMKPSQNFKQ